MTSYTTPEDTAREDATARICEQAWSCKLHRFGKYAPVDWFATRHEQLVGVAECKVRTHASSAYETVWLSLRKWCALHLYAAGVGVRAIFVVSFDDEIRSIDVTNVDARAVRIDGNRSEGSTSRAGVEPVIDVPVSALEIVAIR